MTVFFLELYNQPRNLNNNALLIDGHIYSVWMTIVDKWKFKSHIKNSCAYLQHYFKNWHFIEWTQTHIHTKVILCLYSFFCSILFSLSVSFYCWNNSLFNYKLFFLKNYHYKLKLFYIDFLLPCILLNQLKLIYLIC